VKLWSGQESNLHGTELLCITSTLLDCTCLAVGLRLPFPPPDRLQLRLIRPNEVSCPPSPVSISVPLNFKIRSCLTPKNMSSSLGIDEIHLSNQLIVIRKGIEPLYRELPDIHDLPSDSNRPYIQSDRLKILIVGFHSTPITIVNAIWVGLSPT
jgi:hypothetical protein